MIEYKYNTGEQYIDDILDQLNQFSEPIIGKQQKESKSFYFFETELKGAANIHYSWNWVMLLDMFFENDSILRKLVGTIAKHYRQRAEGIHIRTFDPKFVEKLKTIGFEHKGTIQPDKRYAPQFLMDLYNLERVAEAHEVYIQEEKDKVYQSILDKKGFLGNTIKGTPEYIEDVNIIALDDNKFVGGLIGVINSNSLHIDLLAVDEMYRGKKIGSELMRLAEQEARRVGVVAMDLTTAEFQAKDFYERLGFKVIYTKNNHPKGFKDYKLVKSLT